MEDFNWNFTTIWVQELKKLSSSGISKGQPTALSGNAIALYINLKGRAYPRRKNTPFFYCWPSHIGLAKDLGWDPNKPKNRVSEAVKVLKDAGLIRVWTKDDNDPEGQRLRKKYKAGRTTSLYELTYAKELWYSQLNRNKQLLSSGLIGSGVPSKPKATPIQTDVSSDSIGTKEIKEKRKRKINSKPNEQSSMTNSVLSTADSMIIVSKADNVFPISEVLHQLEKEKNREVLWNYYVEDLNEIRFSKENEYVSLREKYPIAIGILNNWFDEEKIYERFLSQEII